MSLSDLFWLFFIFTALQPVLARRWLEQARLRLLATLERRRGTRVIAMIHRQEREEIDRGALVLLTAKEFYGRPNPMTPELLNLFGAQRWERFPINSPACHCGRDDMGAQDGFP